MLATTRRLIRRIPTAGIHVIFTMLSKGGSAGFSALAAAIIGAAGGATLLGYYALVRVLPAVFVLITEFGISNSYPYLVNRLGYDLRRVYRSGILAAGIVGLVQILAWAALAGLIRQQFLRSVDYEDVLLIGLLAPLQVLLLHATNLQRSAGEFKGANVVFMALEGAVVVALLPALVSDKLNVSYVIHAVIYAHFLVAFAAVGYLAYRGFSCRPKYDREVLAKSLGYGVRAQVGNAFQVLNYRIDQVIIGGMLGADALGPYVIAAKAAELFRFFGTSLVFVLEPIFAGDTVARASSLVTDNLTRVLWVNGAIVLLGVVTVPFALEPVFGDWSAAAIWPFLIISAGMLVSGANGLYGAFNFSIGRPEWNTQVIILGFVVILLANLAFVPILGAVGAALASATMQLAVTIGFRVRFAQSTRPSQPQPNL